MDVRMKFDKRLKALFPALQLAYQRRRPEFGLEGYRERVFTPLDSYSNEELDILIPSGGIISRGILKDILVRSESLPISIDLQYIYASTAYGIKSSRVAMLEYERLGAAWDLLAEASFEFGWASSLSYGEELLDSEYGKQIRKKTSKKANTIQHELAAAVKEWGLTYIRENAPWPSQGSANTALEIVLKAKYGEDHFKDFHGTIKKWLQKMESREKYFKNLD